MLAIACHTASWRCKLKSHECVASPDGVRVPHPQEGDDNAAEASAAAVQAALAGRYNGNPGWGAAHDAATSSALNPFASTVVTVR